MKRIITGIFAVTACVSAALAQEPVGTAAAEARDEMVEVRTKFKDTWSSTRRSRTSQAERSAIERTKSWEGLLCKGLTCHWRTSPSMSTVDCAEALFVLTF